MAYKEPLKIDPAVLERKQAAAPALRIRPPVVYILNEEGRIIDVETAGFSFANKVRKWIGQLFFNTIVTFIPSHTVRLAWLRYFGAEIGKGSSIMRGTQVQDIHYLTIGENTTVGMRCVLDARSGIYIGNNVTLASDVQVLAGGHDINHPDFPVYGPDPTVIEDYVWIASRSMVLPSHIKRGAVVAAHALVIKDIDELVVVGGNPAKPIGKRNPDALHYSAGYRPLFM
jgi:acetyltransferase-like isoleucine patch superfamily enzyme